MDGRLEGLSFDNVKDRMAALAKLMPEAFVEGKLDYDMLMELLGEEAFDDEREKYRFEWKGKAESLRLAQKRSTGTLRPDFDASRDWDRTENLFIEGDNLEVLKLLQAGYLRQVKMIYIDPPYNTGRDFVYADDFADPVGKYKEVTGQGLRANPELSGRYHSNWLSMMYPRLKLAKTLLRDDGVIFISIDDKEVHNLRKICDEVFGEENFIASVIWQKVFSPKNTAKHLSEDHDYIVMYARNADLWRPRLLPRTEEMQSRYKNPDNDPRGPWTSSDMAARNYYSEGTYPVTAPSGREISGPPKGRYWIFSRKKFEEMAADNRIWWGEDGDNVPRVKKFLTEVQDGLVPQTLWFHADVGHTQEAKRDLISLMDFESSDEVFETPKPARLIKQMLRIATTPDGHDLVMDFFAGSGTTAQAVMELNQEDGGDRRFLLVQLPEPLDSRDYPTLAHITRQRLTSAGDRVLASAPLPFEQPAASLFDGTVPAGESPAENAAPPDVGFRVFRLDSTNLIPWDDSPLPTNQPDLFVARMDAHMEERKPDRRDLDVVYEIFLKYGIPLTEKLSRVEAEGHPFHAVGENGYLFIALTPGLTVERVEQVAKQYTPGTMIFADACFPNDDELTNTALALEKLKIEFRWI